MNTLLDVKSVSYTPPADILKPGRLNEEIISNVSFILPKGSITALAGESGSGKTTLAKLISGIIKPSSGSITFNSDANYKKSKVKPAQILFQNSGNIINPYRRIADAVKDMYTASHGKNEDVSGGIKKAMNFAGIQEDVYYKKGFQLSGGEQQRAAIAKIIASKPELIILDEPFSAQDPASRANLVSLFEKINSDLGITILCISHNLHLLKKLCSRLMIMYKGEIVEQGKSEEIFLSPSHPYTKYLLKAESYSLSHNELKYITE